MKSHMETRLECLRLAVMLGSAKVLDPGKVMPFAMEFFRWVDNNPEEKVEVSQLAERFRVSR